MPSPRRPPVSLICVFNDAGVREQCLDRSIERHRSEVEDLDYVQVDNRDGAFRSAGAAYNVGASRARHDHLVFVHQDVVLHSLAALERVAATLEADRRIGLAGALGVKRRGRLAGRVRDRVVLLGERPDGPVDVDAVDEMLFVVPRRTFDREQLTEASEFAWHAYAVDYGLRLRRAGMRVCAVDVPLTHNSFSADTQELATAYAGLRRAYPEALPVRTPSRTVRRWHLTDAREGALLRHAWRARWLHESGAVHAGHRILTRARCLLGDIRWCIDHVLAGADPLLVVNVDRERTFVEDRPDPLALTRLGRALHMTSGDIAHAVHTIRSAPGDASVLATGLRVADLRALAPHLPPARPLLGYRREIGYWLLVGPYVADVAGRLRSRRSTPVGMRGDAA